MVRKYVPKKRTYKKRTAKRSTAIRRVVKQELKKEIEVKFFDRVSTGNCDSLSLTAVSPCQGLIRGTGPNNYVGNKIQPRGLWLNIQTICADPPGNMWRIVIIQDKTTAGIPNMGTLFSSLGVGYPWLAPFNVDFRDTYNVLYDKRHLLTNDGASSTGFLPKVSKIYIPGSKMRSMSFTTVAGSFDAGSLWICMVSDSTVTPNPTFTLLSRFTFTDA